MTTDHRDHPGETTPGISCDSCGMPIESGRYCQYCTDESGQLQPFEERFARMVDWQARRSPGTPRTELESATLTYLSTMPAWWDHPVIRAHVGGGTGR